MNPREDNFVFHLIDIDGQILPDGERPKTKRYTLVAPVSLDLSNLSLSDLIIENFKDARVATVSVLSSSQISSHHSRRVIFPTSNVMILNNSLTDIIGEVNRETLSAWCLDASNRGFFHVEVNACIEMEKCEDLLTGDSYNQRLRMEIAKHDKESYEFNRKSLSVAIDCSWLGENETGAQTLITYFIKSLTAHEAIGEIFLVNLPNSLPSYCVERIDSSRVIIGRPDTNSEVDIFWRPCQPDIFFDALEARNWAKRVVITYFDLIAFDISAYYSSLEEWKTYRDCQVKNGELADLVLTISDDVQNQLRQSIPTINPSRIRTVGVGVDHIFSEVNSKKASASEAIRSATKDRYVLFLGTNYLHKNLDFARKVVEKAFPDGSRPNFVVAGLDPSIGGTAPLTDNPISEFWLGSVKTSDRNYLLANAELVIYPTSAEGFGLVPFEAASFGTPTLFTNFGPLGESFKCKDLPDNWDLESYVMALHKLMAKSDPFRNQLLSEVESLANGRLSWESVTEELLESFLYALELPSVYIDKSSLLKIQDSVSWKITEPLRKIGRFVGRMRNQRRTEDLRKISAN